MPRCPRIKLADVPQHLVQRGLNREPCFFAEEDCHCYLHWLREAVYAAAGVRRRGEGGSWERASSRVRGENKPTSDSEWEKRWKLM